METIYKKRAKNLSEEKKLFLQRYEKEAGTYDKQRYYGKPYWRFLHKIQTRCLDAITKPNKKDRMLDVGCGTGRIMEYFLKKGYNVSGIEPAQNMINECRKKLKEFRPVVKKGDIEHIPFKSNSFDKVYTIHVLFHLPKAVIKKSIKEMYRVTKKGGKIYMDFPNKQGIWTKIDLFLRPKGRSERGERHQLFDIKEIKSLLNRYDYKIEGIFSYPRTLYKVAVLRPLLYVLERYIKLPVLWRSQIIAVVKK